MNWREGMIRQISIHQPLPRLDPLALQADPHRFWAHWREQTPIGYWPDAGAWLVLSYQGVCEALRDERLRTDLYGRVRPLPLPLQPRLLGEAGRALAHRLLERLQTHTLPLGALERCCRQIVEPLAGRQRLDVAREVAAPLAERLVEGWLGLSRHRRVHMAWLLKAAARDGDPARRRIAADMAREAFLAEISRSREQGRDTMLGHLAALWAGEGAEDRDLAALLSPLVFPLIQGTGTRHLVHALLGVLERPELQGAVQSGGLDVARKVAVEAARWLPVTEAAPRRADEPVTICGVTIPAYITVLPILVAACWDPSHHPDPERFDIERPEPSIAFGHGWHQCLGRSLALEVTARALWIVLDLLGPVRAAEPPVFVHELGRACIALPVRPGPRGG
jgi:cytochrome P450